MRLHLQLKERIEQEVAGQLDGEPKLLQDALQVSLNNGVVLEIRYVVPEEYSFHWFYGEDEFRIDTAPLHPGLKTFPNHLHDNEGNVRDDPLTLCGAEPWRNVRAVLQALTENSLAA